eukprot:ctg_757.g358
MGASVGVAGASILILDARLAGGAVPRADGVGSGARGRRGRGGDRGVARSAENDGRAAPRRIALRETGESTAGRGAARCVPAFTGIAQRESVRRAGDPAQGHRAVGVGARGPGGVCCALPHVPVQFRGE